MSDFMRYINAQEEKRHAYTKYSLASKELELTGIKERFYEIISQSDPIASAFPELREGEREREGYKRDKFEVSGADTLLKQL